MFTNLIGERGCGLELAILAQKLFQDDYLCPVNYLYAPGCRLLQPACQITFVEAFTGAKVKHGPLVGRKIVKVITAWNPVCRRSIPDFS